MFAAWAKANPSISGPVIIGLMGGVLWTILPTIKSVITAIFNRIKSLLLFHVEIYYYQTMIHDLREWLHHNKTHFYFVRNFTTEEKLTKETAIDNDDEVVTHKREHGFYMTPSFGYFLYFRWGNPLIFFSRTKDEEKKSYNGNADEYTLSVFIWNKKRFMRMIEQEIQAEPQKRIAIYQFDDYGSHWYLLQHLKRNSLLDESLFTKEQKEIIDDLEQFFNAKQWYQRKKMNHKRGYLIHGKPGTGKSTLIKHIALKYNLNVYYCSYAIMNDPVGALASCEKNSLIVFEDIDTVFGQKRNDITEESKEVSSSSPRRLGHMPSPYFSRNKETIKPTINASLGSMLNALDGIVDYDSCVFMATTNYINKLDDALIRPGRIDIIKKLDNLTPSNIVAIFADFYEINPSKIEAPNDLSMTIADLKGELIKNMHDPKTAANELGLIIENSIQEVA